MAINTADPEHGAEPEPENHLAARPDRLLEISSPNDKFSFRCVICGVAPSEHNDAECPHSPLYDYYVAEYHPSQDAVDMIKNRDLPWQERYLSLLPFQDTKEFQSLGEANTPLIKSKKHPLCYYKDETRNPSGCFKDRESATLIYHLSKLGFHQFSVASSGNAALSAALYSQLYSAKINCYIPKGTSIGKKKLIELFGGKTVETGEYYEDCHQKLASIKDPTSINITAGINPLKDQGNKVIAYEIWEQLKDVPDYIVVPAANGCLLAGIFFGFEDLRKLGLTTKTPTFIGVQITNADPINKALKEGKKDYDICENIPDSLAEGVVAMESYCSPKTLKALRETKGFIVTVDDQEIRLGMKYALQEECLIPEWTSATVFSAIQKIYQQKLVPPDKTIVGVNTGSGLKEIGHIAEEIGKLLEPYREA